MARRPGRPRWQYEKLEKSLATFGGVMAVIAGYEAEGMTWAQIASRLEAVGGVRVHHDTIRKWMSDPKKELKEIVA